MFAMGVSASNCSTDLADKAKAHASARELLIEREIQAYAERTGKSYDDAARVVRSTVQAARVRMKLAGGEQTPNLNDHGVAAPVVVNGEVYRTEGVEYLRGGDREMTISRSLGGGRVAIRKVRLCVDGGERTRVVASARGG